jgi:phosphoglycolate phosphatase
MDFDIVVFDLDGTLYSTEASVVPAVQEAFEELGLTVPDEEEVRRLIGLPTEHYIQWLQEKAAGQEERVVELAFTIEHRLVTTKGRLYPQAEETLEELRRLGCRTALLTNAGAEYVDLVLDTFGIRHLFDIVSFLEGAPVPKALRLRAILEELGDGPAIMVGDRVFDFDAARAVGIPSVGVSHGFGEEELEMADVVVEGLWGVVELKR